MSDDNQIEIAQSFVALYVIPGRSAPSAPHHVVLARYEHCEDIALSLVEPTQMLAFKEGMERQEILRRCHLGLLSDAAHFNESESTWVILRLAELLGWEAPGFEPPGRRPGGLDPIKLPSSHP